MTSDCFTCILTDVIQLALIKYKRFEMIRIIFKIFFSAFLLLLIHLYHPVRDKNSTHFKNFTVAASISRFYNSSVLSDRFFSIGKPEPFRESKNLAEYRRAIRSYLREAKTDSEDKVIEAIKRTVSTGNSLVSFFTLCKHVFSHSPSS